MSVIPEKRQEKIVFYEQHLPLFTSNATQIGLSSAEVTDLDGKTTAARSSLEAHLAARQAAKIATEAYYNAVDAMATTGAGLIKKIRGHAESTGNPAVYTLSGIPGPTTPTSVGNPGKPFDYEVMLLPNGSLESTWECNNPAGCDGVIYQVYRKIESTGTYEYLGGTGEKKFTDLSVPQGVATLMYQIQGTRSTGVGVAAEFTVNFGTTPNGAMTATVATASSQPAKIAA